MVSSNHVWECISQTVLLRFEVQLSTLYSVLAINAFNSGTDNKHSPAPCTVQLRGARCWKPFQQSGLIDNVARQPGSFYRCRSQGSGLGLSYARLKVVTSRPATPHTKVYPSHQVSTTMTPRTLIRQMKSRQWTNSSLSISGIYLCSLSHIH